jgi:hypothetical protein
LSPEEKEEAEGEVKAEKPGEGAPPEGAEEVEKAAEPEEVPCPECGRPYTPQEVVGKTQTFDQGIRSVYDVVLCPCGRTYRGRKISEKKLPKREFRRPIRGRR